MSLTGIENFKTWKSINRRFGATIKGTLMRIIHSTLRKNEIGRWQIGETELCCGSFVEIEIERNWICGVIEFWDDNYYWFSRYDGVPVVLNESIRARLPASIHGRGVIA